MRAVEVMGTEESGHSIMAGEHLTRAARDALDLGWHYLLFNERIYAITPDGYAWDTQFRLKDLARD